MNCNLLIFAFLVTSLVVCEGRRNHHRHRHHQEFDQSLNDEHEEITLCDDVKQMKDARDKTVATINECKKKHSDSNCAIECFLKAQSPETENDGEIEQLSCPPGKSTTPSSKSCPFTSSKTTTPGSTTPTTAKSTTPTTTSATTPSSTTSTTASTTTSKTAPTMTSSTTPTTTPTTTTSTTTPTTSSTAAPNTRSKTTPTMTSSTTPTTTTSTTTPTTTTSTTTPTTTTSTTTPTTTTSTTTPTTTTSATTPTSTTSTTTPTTTTSTATPTTTSSTTTPTTTTSTTTPTTTTAAFRSSKSKRSPNRRSRHRSSIVEGNRLAEVVKSCANKAPKIGKKQCPSSKSMLDCVKRAFMEKCRGHMYRGLPKEVKSFLMNRQRHIKKDSSEEDSGENSGEN